MTKVLAIETSCDETAVAILERTEGGIAVLANIVSSQASLHAAYGGVVPQLAAREHIKNITPVLTEAFAKAGLPDRARSPWEEFHRPYFVQAVTAPGFRRSMTFDVQAAKSVEGWKLSSLAGAFIMEKLRAEGPPEIEKAEFLAKIGGNPVPLDSDQAVQFFEQQAQLQAKDPA